MKYTILHQVLLLITAPSYPPPVKERSVLLHPLLVMVVMEVSLRAVVVLIVRVL